MARSLPFKRHRFRHDGVTIHAVVGGDGPPLLMLHGYPQSHAMWHLVAPTLARERTVVCADLRGYGDSSKPRGLSDHSNYSKRVMAADMVDLMRMLGHDRFDLVGHDRGGRVAHRLARDHGERVRSLTVLDICPTLAMYEQTTMAFARAYYHWFLFIQPQPLPEQMVAAVGLKGLFGRHGINLGSGSGFFAPRALNEYLRCFDARTIHASCEDYRASAGIDLEHDRASRAAVQRIGCDTLVLWGERGVVHRLFKPLDLWRAQCAADVQGTLMPAGHFIPEELPDATAEQLLRFFG